MFSLLNRSSLCALLSGVLLSACGDIQDVGPEVSGEPAGTLESTLCSGLSVSTLTIAGASTYQGEMAASGSWVVSSGANAVRLEYYINNVLYAAEERAGASGTWYFSQTGIACGTRTLMVKAWPMVIDSAGNRSTCWAAPKTASKSVTEACPGGTWQLDSYESCYGGPCSVYSPVCPSSPSGKACQPLNSYCWSVVGPDTVALYPCQ
jgi:hypothetical protein